MNKITILISFLLLLPASALTTNFGVGLQNESDTVYFNSTAKLEFIEGKTQNIKGGFSFEPSNPTDGVKGILQVDLRTLKTGIDTRDGHMRENHLHTDKFPYAYFEIESAEPLPTSAVFDSSFTTKVSGNFYIHGNYRKTYAEVSIRQSKLPNGGESINVRAKFSINLDDYKIPRPKALFLKLAETIEVEAVFSGYSQVISEAVELPDWPEIK